MNDNCPMHVNTDQLDDNSNSIGNACEASSSDVAGSSSGSSSLNGWISIITLLVLLIARRRALFM